MPISTGTNMRGPSYTSYESVHFIPGLVLTNPAPTSASDVTIVPPFVGEMRANSTSLFYCDTAAYDPKSGIWTVNWVQVDWSAGLPG